MAGFATFKGLMARAALPQLRTIAVPILGESIVGMSVAMAGLWLASGLSEVASGAFGLCGQIGETLFVIFRVLGIGLGVSITQALGGGRPKLVRQIALTGFAASSWAGLAAALWVLLVNDWTLAALNAPDEVHQLAAPYLRLLALGLFVDAYNVTMATVLRALLHSHDALKGMLLMHGSHLLLAVPLMRGVGDWAGLGLNGYALAFTVSRVLTMVLFLWLWRRRLQLVPRGPDWWSCPRQLLLQLLRIGVPGATLELVYRLAFMMSISAAAGLGVAALATQAYTLQMLKYVLLVSLSIGWACEIVVGHLVGGGKFRTAHRLVRLGLRNGLFASGGLVLLAALVAPWLMQVFTDDPAVIALARQLLWLSFALETGRVANLVVLGALRSTGDIGYPVMAGMASLIVVLGGGSVLLGHYFGLPGIWVAYAADEWIRGLQLYRRWERHGWVRGARQIYRRMRAPGTETRY